ncbi:hypothetical protein FG386_003541 [Cryptosporidium ryanae]|uniref:uncharacterized protein n=1 Tax=Cryptosporidium ryanae TaxID=515981 RepID=UPI00351A89BB|nr:hypothetical protein FG386_003541 [Cryptosporidium ryanae]
MTLSKIYKQNIDKTDVIIDIFHDNFDKIISNTDNKNPLLIMYYERNCLTCFLIRPFINTLAEKLGKVTDIKFARLNIDEIGINIGSPHIFATPTFVMYYGKDNFIKLEEYKPTEIIDLLFREIKTTNKNETEKIYSDLKNQEKKIYVRFQIFILISIWKMYLIEIENISSCEKKSCIRDIIKKSRELQKITTEFLKNLETGFNNEIPLQNINYESQLMKDNELRNSCIEEVFAKGISEDMERSDTLEENINYMKHELKEIIIDYNILIDILEKSNY